jgi:hypothetical protein
MKFFSGSIKSTHLLILLLTLSHCTGANESKSDEFPAAVSNQYETVKQTRDNSLLPIDIFVVETTKRLNEIGNTLAEINSTYNAERRNLSFEIGEEIFRLNKMHLEVKAKTRFLIENKNDANLEFQASLINDLNLLEAAVSGFKEKKSK